MVILTIPLWVAATPVILVTLTSGEPESPNEVVANETEEPAARVVSP